MSFTHINRSNDGGKRRPFQGRNHHDHPAHRARRFGRVQLLRMSPNTMRECRWGLHLDNNNQGNPESNGWIVRIWLELTSDPSSALVVRPGIALEPLVYGGGQESGLRAGTENVAFAVGLGEAARLATAALAAGELDRVRELRDRLHTGLDQALPGRAHKVVHDPGGIFIRRAGDGRVARGLGQ